MTATIDASAAVIKLRYPEGKLPKSVYERSKAKAVSTMEVREDWKGGDWVIALQNENPQGSASTVAVAQGSLAQGVYNKFTVSRVNHYGVARIKGDALLAVGDDVGGLVDLWMNEMQGISTTEVINHEVYWFGNGTGVLAQIASGSTTDTATLSDTTTSARLSLNMRVKVVNSSTSLSPTVKGGIGTISAINRVSGTVTLSAGTWLSTCGASASNDFIVRAGDEAVGGTATVVTGVRSWIVGGTSPGTLFGLSRNSDPTRLAGLTYDATGVSREEAVIEASARVNAQGAPQPTVGFAHPRDIADFKKAVGAKATYPRTTMNTKIAQVSFSGIEVIGDEENITLVSSPFVERNTLILIDPESWTRRSLKAAPHLQNYDSNEFLRVGADDAWEVRFASMQNYGCSLPFANIVVTNWGL